MNNFGCWQNWGETQIELVIFGTFGYLTNHLFLLFPRPELEVDKKIEGHLIFVIEDIMGDGSGV